MNNNLNKNTLANKAKVIVTEEFMKKVQFLCKQCPEKEWSGTLIYKVDGTIEDPQNMIITPMDIYLMDIGSKAYTEYDTDKSVVDFIVKNNYLEYNQGKIHSHNSFGVFHSGTDMKDLEDNSDKFNYYASMIVNNAMDMEMKISFIAKIETEEIPYFAINEQGDKYQLNLKETLHYQQLFVLDTDIEKAEVEFEEDNIFVKRFYDVLKQAQTNVSKIKNTGFKQFESFSFNQRKRETNFQQQDLFEIPNQEEIDWDIEDGVNEIDDFVCYVLRFGKPIKSDTVESVIEDLLMSTRQKIELLDFVNKITNTGKYFDLYKKYFGKQANSLHPEVFLGNTNAFLERIADEEMTYPELKPVITSFTNMYQRYEKSLNKSLNKKETV
jgi:hypothetical protein